MSWTKLELTWPGKNKAFELEPRILIEKPELSYGDPMTENMLIHWDNLLALKALEQQYNWRIKCIYIDPPYNTWSAFEYYDDGLEHTEWLNLMRPRLELLRNLLADDWLIFVQIDDNEQAYLTVMMDEIFWRKNRLNTICIKMSEVSWVKMAHVDRRLPKIKEYILVYYKNEVPKITAEKVPLENWNPEYKNILLGLNEEEIDEVHQIIQWEYSEDNINRCNELLKKWKIKSLDKFFKEENIKKSEQEQRKFDHAKYIIQAVGSSSVFNIAKNTKLLDQDVMAVKSSSWLIYLIKTDFDEASKQPRVQVIFADLNLMQSQGDLRLDIKTTWGVWQEWDVLFANSKKPEKLIKKIITMCTSPWDLVLDSFLWSWTTVAVAHKMWRKWIWIELWDHAYSHCKVRLDKVIDWEQTGISKIVEREWWGWYKFYELWPSVLLQDKYWNYIINPNFNSSELVQAICKIENFTYKAFEDNIKHWYSTEKDFIHVTTRHITQEIVKDIQETSLKSWETMLIVAKTFESNLDLPDNIQIKKIPTEILDKCEYNKDNYSLPISEEDIKDED